jgi:predicted PurR-regulated permease PerM
METKNKTHWWIWLLIAVAFGWFLNLISPILLPFVVGMGVAYLLDPLADRLESRGLSRTKATSIISVVFFVIIALVLAFIIPLLAEQIGGLINSAPSYINFIQEHTQELLKNASQKLPLNNAVDNQKIAQTITENIHNFALNFVQNIVKSGLVLINFVGLLCITPVVSFYLLRDWDKVLQHINELLPRRYAPIICEQARLIDKTLSAFLHGTLNVMLVQIVYYLIMLFLIGMPYSVLIAIMAGSLIIVPYVGTLLSAGLALAVSFVHFNHDLQMMIWVGLVFVLGQIIEGYILTPKLVGSSVGLNGLWIIFGMMAGGALLGFVGVLLAVPITAVLGVLMRFGISEYKKTMLYND